MLMHNIFAFFFVFHLANAQHSENHDLFGDGNPQNPGDEQKDPVVGMGLGLPMLRAATAIPRAKIGAATTLAQAYAAAMKARADAHHMIIDTKLRQDLGLNKPLVPGLPGLHPGLGGLRGGLPGMARGALPGLYGLNQGLPGLNHGLPGLNHGLSGLNYGLSGLNHGIPGLSGLNHGITGLTGSPYGLSGFHTGLSSLTPRFQLPGSSILGATQNQNGETNVEDEFASKSSEENNSEPKQTDSFPINDPSTHQQPDFSNANNQEMMNRNLQALLQGQNIFAPNASSFNNPPINNYNHPYMQQRNDFSAYGNNYNDPNLNQEQMNRDLQALLTGQGIFSRNMDPGNVLDYNPFVEGGRDFTPQDLIAVDALRNHAIINEGFENHAIFRRDVKEDASTLANKNAEGDNLDIPEETVLNDDTNALKVKKNKSANENVKEISLDIPDEVVINIDNNLNEPIPNSVNSTSENKKTSSPSSIPEEIVADVDNDLNDLVDKPQESVLSNPEQESNNDTNLPKAAESSKKNSTEKKKDNIINLPKEAESSKKNSTEKKKENIKKMNIFKNPLLALANLHNMSLFNLSLPLLNPHKLNKGLLKLSKSNINETISNNPNNVSNSEVNALKLNTTLNDPLMNLNNATDGHFVEPNTFLNDTAINVNISEPQNATDENIAFNETQEEPTSNTNVAQEEIKEVLSSLNENNNSEELVGDANVDEHIEDALRILEKNEEMLKKHSQKIKDVLSKLEKNTEGFKTDTKSINSLENIMNRKSENAEGFVEDASKYSKENVKDNIDETGGNIHSQEGILDEEAVKNNPKEESQNVLDEVSVKNNPKEESENVSNSSFKNKTIVKNNTTNNGNALSEVLEQDEIYSTKETDLLPTQEDVMLSKQIGLSKEKTNSTDFADRISIEDVADNASNNSGIDLNLSSGEKEASGKGLEEFTAEMIALDSSKSLDNDQSAVSQENDDFSALNSEDKPASNLSDENEHSSEKGITSENEEMEIDPLLPEGVTQDDSKEVIVDVESLTQHGDKSSEESKPESTENEEILTNGSPEDDNEELVVDNSMPVDQSEINQEELIEDHSSFNSNQEGRSVEDIIDNSKQVGTSVEDLIENSKQVGASLEDLIETSNQEGTSVEDLIENSNQEGTSVDHSNQEELVEEQHSTNDENASSEENASSPKSKEDAGEEADQEEELVNSEHRIRKRNDDMHNMRRDEELYLWSLNNFNAGNGIMREASDEDERYPNANRDIKIENSRLHFLHPRDKEEGHKCTENKGLNAQTGDLNGEAGSKLEYNQDEGRDLKIQMVDGSKMNQMLNNNNPISAYSNLPKQFGHSSSDTNVPLQQNPTSSYSNMQNNPTSSYSTVPMPNNPTSLYSDTPIENNPTYSNTPMQTNPTSSNDNLPIQNNPSSISSNVPMHNNPSSSYVSPISSNLLENNPTSSYSHLPVESIPGSSFSGTISPNLPIQNNPSSSYSDTSSPNLPMQNTPTSSCSDVQVQNNPSSSYSDTISPNLPMQNTPTSSYSNLAVDNIPSSSYSGTISPNLPIQNNPSSSYSATSSPNLPVQNNPSSSYSSLPIQDDSPYSTIPLLNNPASPFTIKGEDKDSNNLFEIQGNQDFWNNHNVYYSTLIHPEQVTNAQREAVARQHSEPRHFNLFGKPKKLHLFNKHEKHFETGDFQTHSNFQHGFTSFDKGWQQNKGHGFQQGGNFHSNQQTVPSVVINNNQFGQPFPNQQHLNSQFGHQQQFHGQQNQGQFNGQQFGHNNLPTPSHLTITNNQNAFSGANGNLKVLQAGGSIAQSEATSTNVNQFLRSAGDQEIAFLGVPPLGGQDNGEIVNSPYLLQFPYRRLAFHKRTSEGLRRRRRSLPLVRLMADPNTKLDMPKTLENVGTIAKKSFEDKRAPMYHVKNMIGATKDAFLSSLKIAPQNVIIPSRYKIVDTKEEIVMKHGDLQRIKNEVRDAARSEFENVGSGLLKESRVVDDGGKRFPSLKEFFSKLRAKNDVLPKIRMNEGLFKNNIFSRAHEPNLAAQRFSLFKPDIPAEDTDPDFLKTFHKVGSVIRDSIRSSQETVNHINNVAHSARKAYTTSKFSLPRILLPYSNAPVVKSTLFDNDHLMMISPRFLDVTEEDHDRPDSPDEYVRMGEIMDAFGVSKPGGENVGLSRIIIQKKKDSPILQSRFGGEEDAPPIGREFYVISESVDDPKNSESIVVEAFKGLKELKELIGVNSIKDFLEEMKREFKALRNSNTPLESRMSETENDIDEEELELRRFLTELFENSTKDKPATNIPINSRSNFDDDDNTPNTADEGDNTTLLDINKPIENIDDRANALNELINAYSNYNDAVTDIPLEHNNSTTEINNEQQLPEVDIPGSIFDQIDNTGFTTPRSIIDSPAFKDNAHLKTPNNDPAEPKSILVKRDVNPHANDAIVGSGMNLPPNLFHPFMNQPTRTELEDYFRAQGDDLADIELPEYPENLQEFLKLTGLVSSINPDIYKRLFNESLAVGDYKNIDPAKVFDVVEDATLKSTNGEVDEEDRRMFMEMHESLLKPYMGKVKVKKGGMNPYHPYQEYAGDIRGDYNYRG